MPPSKECHPKSSEVRMLPSECIILPSEARMPPSKVKMSLLGHIAASRSQDVAYLQGPGFRPQNSPFSKAVMLHSEAVISPLKAFKPQSSQGAALRGQDAAAFRFHGAASEFIIMGVRGCPAGEGCPSPMFLTVVRFFTNISDYQGRPSPIIGEESFTNDWCRILHQSLVQNHLPIIDKGSFASNT